MMTFLTLKCIPTYLESKNNIACKPFSAEKKSTPQNTFLLFIYNFTVVDILQHGQIYVSLSHT